MEQLEFLRYLDSKYENESLLFVKLPCGVPVELVNSGCCTMAPYRQCKQRAVKFPLAVKCGLDLCQVYGIFILLILNVLYSASTDPIVLRLL